MSLALPVSENLAQPEPAGSEIRQSTGTIFHDQSYFMAGTGAFSTEIFTRKRTCA